MANVIDPNKVSCSIDFESKWTLKGNDCSYERVFIITYNVVSDLTIKNFFYSIKDTEYSCSPKFVSNNTYRYSFTLNESTIAANRNNGTLKISARVLASQSDQNTIYVATSTKSDLIELPPESNLQNLKIEQYTSVPGKFKCSWTAPSLYKNKAADEEVNGYCIRLEHLKAGEGSYSRIRGLKLTNGKLVKDFNYKEIVYVDISELTTEQKISFIENNDITFAGMYADSPKVDEVYLDGTSFDFVPKELGIESGDEYIFTIYPYNNIGTYIIDNGNGTGSTAVGTRLTNAGTSRGTKTSKGIVRVKHDNKWKEGQVWVMTTNGWKQAQAIYAKKADGWKEAK